MEMQDELEQLRRDREEKTRQIEEKRKQVEELRRKRAQRSASHQIAAEIGRKERGQNVDDLVAEILGGGALNAADLRTIAPAAEAGGANTGEQRPGRNFQQEFRINMESVMPLEQEVYERSCQTDETGEMVSTRSAGAGNVQAQAPTNLVNKLAEKVKMRQKPSGPAARPKPSDKAEEKPEEEKQELSQEEKDRLMKRPDFTAFFTRATLLVERTLGSQDWEFAKDWKSGEQTETAEKQDSLKHSEDFAEEKWSKQRPVTDVRFSPHQKEMFLAAYGQRSDPAPTDPDGCMLVWNLAMKSRPELTFVSPSPVLSATFHRFDQNIFFGGLNSGGIVLWDARERNGPVVRTPLNTKQSHSQPVQALQQVGTQHATSLVSASNDGRLCVWSLSMLNMPQETIDLKPEAKGGQKREVSVMTMSFPENETNVLYVGAEDGSVCQVNLRGSKVGVTEYYDGHDGPVAGIDFHPHQQEAANCGLDTSFALTSSFDWSVKLWMVKQHLSPVLVLDTFEDYVYDVKWHPQHPAVFSSVDGEGHVDLWNLNLNTESPVVRCKNHRKLALNHCHWSSDGKRLAAGDSEGTIGVYSVDRRISEPRNEDFQQFAEKTRSMQPVVQKRESSYDRSSYGLTRGLESSRH